MNSMKNNKYLIYVAVISCIIFIISGINLILNLDTPSIVGKYMTIPLFSLVVFLVTLVIYYKGKKY